MTKAPSDEELREALAGLWTRAYGELEIQVRYTLTEPACPTAIITTETGEGPFFRADQDTIPMAVRHVMLVAYCALILRQPVSLVDTHPLADQLNSEKVATFLATLDAEHSCEVGH